IAPDADGDTVPLVPGDQVEAARADMGAAGAVLDADAVAGARGESCCPRHVRTDGVVHDQDVAGGVEQHLGNSGVPGDQVDGPTDRAADRIVGRPVLDLDAAHAV